MLIEQPTRLEAWIAATEHLLKADTDLNVVLSISSPGSDGPNAAKAHAIANSFLRSEGQYPLHTVAETIFPGWEYKRRGLKGVFETYVNEEYDLIKDGWGRYAHRLLYRRRHDGKVLNPLKILIEKMRKAHQKDTASYRSCYEIGLDDPDLELPTYDTATNARQVRGFPCLSHLSFKLVESRVYLTALYRMHDYRFKVLGNMLGLARLQACVAKEVGAKIGELVVHSTYAYTEGGKGKAALRNLIGNVKQAIGKE